MSTSAEFWEERYAGATAVWSGRVNQTLAELVQPLSPGSALDLGCGEGGDAIWLASRGWAVTGVDISQTAISRATAAATARDLTLDQAVFVTADLTEWMADADAEYDLVVASFLQSPVGLDRGHVLREAARRVAPGGHLIFISHAAPPPWMTGHRPATAFPQPEGELAELQLDVNNWLTMIAEIRTRVVKTPEGDQASLEDTVVMVRRTDQ